jgi:hypothetical protein
VAQSQAISSIMVCDWATLAPAGGA